MVQLYNAFLLLNQLNVAAVHSGFEAISQNLPTFQTVPSPKRSAKIETVQITPLLISIFVYTFVFLMAFECAYLQIFCQD